MFNEAASIGGILFVTLVHLSAWDFILSNIDCLPCSGRCHTSTGDAEASKHGMVPILMKLITPLEDKRVNTGRKKFQMMIMLCEEKERESQGGGVCEVMGGVEATEEASEEG